MTARYRFALLVFAACVVASAFSFAQTSSTATKSTGKLSANDQKFLHKAAEGGIAQVEFGKLAEQNAQSQDVKDFGKRMVDDHSRANDELQQIAAQQGATLPSGLSSSDNTTKEHLSKMKGDSFDKAYMRHMVVDHETDVSGFKQEARGGSDPQLKDWATKTLPTLEQNLQLAQHVDSKVKTEGAKPAGAATPKQ